MAGTNLYFFSFTYIYYPRTLKILKSQMVTQYYAVMPELGGPGGHCPPPIFDRSVNPIQTGEGRLSLPITTGTPKKFHLPASLNPMLI